MIILKLNKPQAKQLLKLAKRFFPEYNKIEIVPLFIGNDFYNEVQSLSTINFWTNWNGQNGEAFESDSLESIDWYQFCINQLPKRIRESLKDNVLEIEELLSSRSFQFALIHNAKHPVDYLAASVKYMNKYKYFKIKK